MTKSSFLILVFFLGVLNSQAQVFMTNTAKVQFFSETPVENISAVNSSVASLINSKTDSVFFKMKNTSFVFKNALMQDHFNENYMESQQYPFSTFKGKLNEAIDFSKDGVYPVSVSGKMAIHGVERPVTATGQITVKDNKVTLASEILVRTADYKIEVPKLVFQKIAQEIKINISGLYLPLKN